jgi:hypothetical protein
MHRAKNFITNHVKNLVFLYIFGLVTAEPDILFAVVQQLPKRVGDLVFGDGSDNLIPVRLEALLGAQQAPTSIS